MALEGAAMEFIQPASWSDALAIKAATAGGCAAGRGHRPDGGAELRRPGSAGLLLDLTRITDLTEWDRADGRLRLGAGVTYTRIICELGGVLPGLAMAARTVGSPQIRNRGTVGGNLGTASPASTTAIRRCWRARQRSRQRRFAVPG